MEFQPDTQVCTFYPETRVPDAKGARRAASLCSFAAVAEITIAYALLIPTTLLTRDISMSDQMRSNLSLIINTAVIDLIAMPLCWLLLLLIPKDASPEIGTRTPLSFKKLLFYFPCAFVLMLAGSLTGRLIDALLGGDLSNVVSDTMSAVDPWVTLLCAVIVGPIAEELFFRKAMIDRLSAYHPTDAILLSALLFGLIHGNLTQFLYAFPLGVLFGIIYYRTQNIGYTIVLHVVINCCGGLLPQLLTMLEERAPEYASSLVSLLYMQFVLAMCVLGIIFLIRRRRAFLPIPSDVPRFRRPFYINAGFIVASIVFTALFVLTEILA